MTTHATFIHCHRHGAPVCNPSLGSPSSWPEHHGWLNEEQFREKMVSPRGQAEDPALCQACRMFLDEEDHPHVIVLDEEELIASLPLPRSREPVATKAKVRVFDSKEALARGIDAQMKAKIENALKENPLGLSPEAAEILRGNPEPFREKVLAEAEAREGKMVRDLPNYQRPAFTLEEAEKHALVHQTVGAFRMLKALHEALELMTVAETVALEEHEQLGKACLKVVQLQKQLDEKATVTEVKVTEDGFDQDVWDVLSLFPAEVGRATTTFLPAECDALITLLQELQAKRREVKELIDRYDLGDLMGCSDD